MRLESPRASPWNVAAEAAIPPFRLQGPSCPSLGIGREIREPSQVSGEREKRSLRGIATVYVRYKQVYALNPGESKITRLNKAGFTLGVISCFGLCIIASFQKYPLFYMHVIGACLTFGVGAIYILVQTILSYTMQQKIFWIRVTVLLWCGTSIASMFVSSVLLYSGLYGTELVQKLHWDPHEKGYIVHISSTISEWSLAFSFLSFFLTYIRDFQKISLRADVSLSGHNLCSTPNSFVADERTLLIGGHL
ncbi:DNA damage-regulated autophagy modulator protein 2 isoform X3 [Carettochelys insculpta]|uniref:DNA damage-regulated autophagy modulator protein 2 isoform X3 n=1 Tax=Carettochelys insculpta TaxID=44489 RepID=UPI003EBB0400